MTAVVITLDEGRTSFLPWGRVAGSVGWSVPEVPSSIEVRLAWKTSGKGDSDSAIVQTFKLSSGRTQGQERFQFDLPEGPYSFSGRLISLVWTIEVAIKPGNHSTSREIVLSPSGSEIDLYASAKLT
jgi:hypothetical protein